MFLNRSVTTITYIWKKLTLLEIKHELEDLDYIFSLKVVVGRELCWSRKNDV